MPFLLWLGSSVTAGHCTLLQHEVTSVDPLELTFLLCFLKVGDILEVRNNEQIPADLIILASALPQNSAYIETANIDGESNLKLKVAAGVGGQPLSGSSPGPGIGSDDSQRKAQLFKRSA